MLVSTARGLVRLPGGAACRRLPKYHLLAIAMKAYLLLPPSPLAETVGNEIEQGSPRLAESYAIVGMAYSPSARRVVLQR